MFTVSYSGSASLCIDRRLTPSLRFAYKRTIVFLRRCTLMFATKVQNPERVKLRRKQIYQGAMRVFRKKGFHAASIREIARASRLSPGALYNYIEKKEDILYLVHEEILNYIYDCLDRALKQHNDPVRKLVHVVEEIFQLGLRLKEETLFMYTETKSLEKKYLHKVLQKESEFVGRLESLITEGVDGGDFDCKHPAIFANILALLMAFIPLRSWNIKPYHTDEEVLEEFVTLIMRGLKVESLDKK